MSSEMRIVNAFMLHASNDDLRNFKKALQFLDDIYMKPKCIREIANNSKWPNFLKSVHRLVTFEAELFNAQNVATPKNRRMDADIITAVKYSNNFVERSEILSMISDILSYEPYNYYHNTYLTIMKDYFLAQPIYMRELTLQEWKLLINILINRYDKSTSEHQKSIILSIMHNVLENACTNTSLSLEVKAILQFVGKVFHDIYQCELTDLLSRILEIVYVIYCHISPQNIFCLCAYGEKFIPDLINMKECNQKYKILRLFVQTYGSNKTLLMKYEGKFNINKWRLYINDIYWKVLFDSDRNISDDLIKLGCEVFRLILQEPDIIHMESETVEKNIEISNIITKYSEGKYNFILPLVNCLLQKYTECLKEDDYVPLLETVRDIFSENFRNRQVVVNLCEIAATLKVFEKRHNNILTKAPKIQRTWMIILTFILRGITIYEIEEANYDILRHIVSHETDLDMTAFLNSYIVKCKVTSPLIAEIIQIFCKEHLWKCLDNVNSKKLQLLSSVLNISWEKLSFCTPINKISYIITFLVGGTVSALNIDTFAKDKTSSVTDFIPETFNNSSVVSLDKISKYYESLNFTVSLLEESQLTDCKSDDLEVPASSSISETNKTTLISSLVELSTKIANLESDVALSVTILKIAYIMKVTSDLKTVNVIHEDDASTTLLRSLAKEGLSKVYSKLLTLDVLELDFHETINIFEALFIFYSGISFDSESIQTIISETSVTILKHLFKWSKTNHDSLEVTVSANCHIIHRHRCQKKLNKSRLTKRELLKVCSIRILTAFSCLILERPEPFGPYTIVLEILFSGKWVDQTSTIDFKLIVKMLETFQSVKAEHHSTYYFNKMTELAIILYCKMYTNLNISTSILRMLPRLFQLAMDLDSTDQTTISNISKLFYYYYDNVLKNVSGLYLSLEFLKCLIAIIKMDNSKLSAILSRDQSPVLFDVLLTCMTNPFYPVRLEVAKCIYQIFISKNSFNEQWKLSFIQEILNDSWMKNALGDSCKKLRNDYEKMDYDMVRAASAVTTIAAIIRNDSELIWSEGLLIFFRLKVTLNLTTGYATEVLKEIVKSRGNVIETGLNFLLVSWLTSESSFETFPWDLLGFECQKDFYRTHIQVLFPMLINDTKYQGGVARFCQVTELTFEEIVELTFVPVMIFLLSKPNDVYAREIFEKIKSGKEEFNLSKPYKTLLHENLGQIFICAVSRLNGAVHFSKIFGISEEFLPDRKFFDPLQLNITQVDNILKLLELELDLEEGSLIHFVTTKHPGKMQRILTHFTLEINKNMFNKWRLRTLYQYTYACQLIGTHLKFPYFDHLAPYVIRDISYTLIHLMKKANSDHILGNATAISLYLFLKNALPVRFAIIKEHLNIYITGLCRQFQVSNFESQICLETLRFIIIENGHLFGNIWQQVNPLPQRIKNLLDISDQSDNLRLAIQRFLNNHIIYDERDLNDVFVVESLLYLKEQLSTRKQELNDLMADLEKIDGFTEDCATSLIHQTIHRLVKFTKSSILEIKLEAVSCLGKLSFKNLNTITLYPDKLFIQEVIDCKTILAHQTICLLTQLLIKDDVHLRQVSCDALYNVLESIPDNWVKQLPSDRILRNLEAAITKKEIWHRTGTAWKLQVELIYPFILESKSQRQNESKLRIDEEEFNKFTNLENDFWTIKSTELSFSEWTRTICTSLANCFKNNYIQKLVPVFQLSSTFCAEILPRIVYLTVRDNATRIETLSKVIDAFFCFTQKSDDLVTERVQCMLNVVNYFRVQVDKKANLTVNYLNIAKSAVSCCAFYTASLFVEIWSIDFLNQHPQNDLSLPVLDHIYRIDPESAKAVQGIIRQVYASISLSDVIYYCSSLHCRDRSSLIQYYKDTEQWDKVLLMYDAELQWKQMTDSNSTGNSIKEIFNAMRHLDLHHFIVSMQKLTFNNYSEVSDCAYESLWRLSEWDSFPKRETGQTCYNSSSNDYAFHHYKALQLLHESKLEELKCTLNEARQSVIRHLYNISFESSASIKPYLLEAQMLQEIEDMSKTQREEEIIDLFFKWQNEDSLDKIEYLYAEQILYQRIVGLQMRDSFKDISAIKNAISSLCLNFIELAKQQGHTRVVLQLLNNLKQLRDMSNAMKFELEFQKASIIWRGGNMEQGRRNLQNILRNESVDIGFRARCLEACASWAAENQAEHPEDIARTFQDALKTFETATDFGETDRKTLLKARLNMARFVDKEYVKLVEQLKSTQFKVLKQGVKTLMDIVPNEETNPEIRRAKYFKKRNLEKDAEELLSIEEQQNMYLLLALESYALNLQQDDNNDSVIFRLITLWLSNNHNELVSEVIRKYVETIPSYKFLLLIPQLVPRINSTVPHFASNVKILILKCAKEHPYHTLPVLLAMKHQYEDMKYQNNPKIVDPQSDPKTMHASALIDELKEDIGGIIRETETLSMALIMLAYWKAKPKGSEKIVIPKTQGLSNIQNFQFAADPTMHVDIRRNGRYDNIVTVVKYKSTFEYVGGNNAPKKVICMGSDGICRPQLLKVIIEMQTKLFHLNIIDINSIHCTITTLMLHHLKPTTTLMPEVAHFLHKTSFIPNYSVLSRNMELLVNHRRLARQRQIFQICYIKLRVNIVFDDQIFILNAYRYPKVY